MEKKKKKTQDFKKLKRLAQGLTGKLASQDWNLGVDLQPVLYIYPLPERGLNSQVAFETTDAEKQ